MDDAHAATLPDDPQALKALCIAMMRERDESLAQRDQSLAQRDESFAQRDESFAQRDQAVAERDHLIAVRQQLADRCDALRSHVAWLRRQLYGPRADRLQTPEDVGQMHFEFAHGLESMPIDPECIPPEDRGGRPDPSDARRVRAKRKKSGRTDISRLDHLPKTECRHELPEAERVCPCCGKTRDQIGTPLQCWGELADRPHSRAVHAIPPHPRDVRLSGVRRRGRRRAGRDGAEARRRLARGQGHGRAGLRGWDWSRGS